MTEINDRMALTQLELKVTREALQHYLDEAITNDESNATIGEIYRTLAKFKSKDNIAVRSHSSEG